MGKDEKNIENIEELSDFEETSADVSMDSMFSSDLADVEEETTEEMIDESLTQAQNDEEAIEKVIQEEVIQEEITEETQETSPFLKEIEEIEEVEEVVEENSIAPIEEYKPQENYVSTADDFEEIQASEKMITVRPVKFQEFKLTQPNRTIKKNLDILQDVSMHISVELGRTKSSIREVMEMEQGSIVELDKVAGEQVEIFVNEKLVAKGEVIVIEDKFGVRVTSTSFPKNIV